jgi:hypothetical protein
MAMQFPRLWHDKTAYQNDHVLELEPYQPYQPLPDESRPIEHHPSASLGCPCEKPVLDNISVAAAVISVACCALALAVVVDQSFAWHLGLTNQLILIGLLLSVMNMCLKTVAPDLFLQIEARFGPSHLQNYDAILRNRPFAAQTDILWRLGLLLLAALPLGLSAAYKLFAGGTSNASISTTLIPQSSWGMYGHPGTQRFGLNRGMALMLNATTPFIEASTSDWNPSSAGVKYEDPIYDPAIVQTFGYNILVINESTTAVLDMPSPEWIAEAQTRMKPGESWNVSATVLATGSVYNDTIDDHLYDDYDTSSFWNGYNGQGGLAIVTLYDGWSLGLITNDQMNYNRDQSWYIIGLFKDPGNATLSTFAPYASMYSVKRWTCAATWTLTSSAINLIDGACGTLQTSSMDALTPNQTIFENNQLAISPYYRSILAELLGPFGTIRNESTWQNVTIGTAVAAMVWSRTTVLDGPGLMTDLGQEKQDELKKAGLMYNVTASVWSSRVTLERSWLLYAVLVIQPVLTLAILIAGTFLYAVPIGRGFGMCAVLAGIDKSDLDVLQGAGLSGTFKEKVRLVYRVQETGIREASVRYGLSTSGTQARGTTMRGWVYS